MTKTSKNVQKQKGITLIGLIFWLAILGFIALIGAKVVPTFIEYNSIKKAIVSVKTHGGSVQEIQNAFDKQTDVGYISAIQGKDLDVSKNGDDIEISFAYQKKIPIIAPVSLLIDYTGTTSASGVKKAQ
ncbi:MAG: DUF4845 domain-containing protein [Glaciimonas sp.]|nr:DUF4845 domain-containing protein [Glaciimonas sp.]